MGARVRAPPELRGGGLRRQVSPTPAFSLCPPDCLARWLLHSDADNLCLFAERFGLEPRAVYNDYEQMLDELVSTGYEGTELGDWGYMPTAPADLDHELSKRKLTRF